MKRLHVECLPDECLMKVLGQPAKNIIHHNDKGRVCNFLEKNQDMIGMIDEDPGSAQPSYLYTLSEVSNQHKVRILQDKARENKIIVICPRLEEWIIDICKLHNVNMEKFGLSNRANSLHREVTSKLKSFEKLLIFLLNEIKAPQLLHLKKSIS